MRGTGRSSCACEAVDPAVTASTLTEAYVSPKTGGPARPGLDRNAEPLERARIAASGQVLTTNFGQPIADNQNTLKAGLRGPAILADFILREKLTHFDHERIPERIVHARGSGAHGFFECDASLAHYTRAAFLSAPGKRTPVFVRFSTVAGERGSMDTPRDVRGFATKFYTEEGNFDIVGNNIPVFFIQDAIKFPDLVHALKPEPEASQFATHAGTSRLLAPGGPNGTRPRLTAPQLPDTRSRGGVRRHMGEARQCSARHIYHPAQPTTPPGGTVGASSQAAFQESRLWPRRRTVSSRAACNRHGRCSPGADGAYVHLDAFVVGFCLCSTYSSGTAW